MRKSKFILGGIIFIVLLLGCIMWLTFNKNQNYETSDISQYGEMKNKLKGKVFSGLDIFPKEIENIETKKNYYMQYGRKNLDYSVQVYLECEYGEEQFQQELERLSKMKETYEKYQLHHFIVKDVENFDYPAYVMIFQNNYTYEYALIDEENKKIIYIYLQHTNYEDLMVDGVYLDKKYKEYMKNGESEIGYNQYGFSSSEYENKANEQ